MLISDVCSVLRDSVLSDFAACQAPLSMGILQARILVWVATLFQGIFLTQGSNPGLPHCRWILYLLSHKGSPRILEWVTYPFSRRSSQPRNQTWVFCTASRFFTLWATRATPRLIYWSLNSQFGGIWRCGLWEVIRFRWSHEGGAPMMGLVPL